MRRADVVRLTAIALVVTVSFIGCRRGATTAARRTSPSSVPSERSIYIGRADAICRDTTQRLQSLPSPPPSPGHDALAAYYAQIGPILEAKRTALAALARPAADVGADRLREIDTAQISNTAAAVDSARRGDEAALRAAVAKSAELSQQFDDAAGAQGYVDCARS